jgi:hypothetical protein
MGFLMLQYRMGLVEEELQLNPRLGLKFMTTVRVGDEVMGGIG